MTTAEGEACAARTSQVTAVTDKSRPTTPGAMPQLSLTVTNTGSKDCVLNAGTAQQVFTITSGDEVYWVSTDCQIDSVDAEVTLQPGVPIELAPRRSPGIARGRPQTPVMRLATRSPPGEPRTTSRSPSAA